MALVQNSAQTDELSHPTTAYLKSSIDIQSSANAADDSADATTTSTIATLRNQAFRPFVAGSRSTDTISTNVDDSSTNITDGWTSTTFVVNSATVTTYVLDTNATLATIRCVRERGTCAGAAMAITRLIFAPTLLLMFGPTVLGRSTITSIIHPLALGSSSAILLVALISEVVALAIEAVSIAFPSLPDTEADDASLTIHWGEHMKLVSKCLAVVAVVLFLVGVGSLALAYASES